MKCTPTKRKKYKCYQYPRLPKYLRSDIGIASDVDVKCEECGRMEKEHAFIHNEYRICKGDWIIVEDGITIEILNPVDFERNYELL